MKKILFLFLLISGVVLQAQTTLNKESINGKYEFTYNETKCVVEVNSSNNTFIESNKNGDQLTIGNFILTSGTYYFTPTTISNKSQIDIPVNLKVIKKTTNELTVIFNSSEVKNYTLSLTKL